MDKKQKLTKEIKEKAKIDFKEALGKDNFIEADDIFEKALLDLLQRAERRQYSPNFLASQGVIYWRCIVQYFRKIYEDDKLEGINRANKEELVFLENEVAHLKINKDVMPSNKRAEIYITIKNMENRIEKLNQIIKEENKNA